MRTAERSPIRQSGRRCRRTELGHGERPDQRHADRCSPERHRGHSTVTYPCGRRLQRGEHQSVLIQVVGVRYRSPLRSRLRYRARRGQHAQQRVRRVLWHDQRLHHDRPLGGIGERFRFGGTTGFVTVGTATSTLKTAGSMTVALSADFVSIADQTILYIGLPNNDNGGAHTPSGTPSRPVDALASCTRSPAAGPTTRARPRSKIAAVGRNNIAFVRDATAKNYRFYLAGKEDVGGAISYANNPTDFGSCIPLSAPKTAPACTPTCTWMTWRSGTRL